MNGKRPSGFLTQCDSGGRLPAANPCPATVRLEKPAPYRCPSCVKKHGPRPEAK